MLRVLVSLSFVVAAIMAAPINTIDDIPAEYRDLIPDEVKEFIISITEEEKQTIKEIFNNYAFYKSREGTIAAIKEKSPSLFEKMENTRLLFRERFDALGDEAKAFAKEVIEDIHKVAVVADDGKNPYFHELKLRIKSGVEKYSALPDAAKADLDEQFPIISFFKTDKFQKSLMKLLKMN